MSLRGGQKNQANSNIQRCWCATEQQVTYILYSSFGSVKDGKVIYSVFNLEEVNLRLKFTTIYQNYQYPAGYPDCAGYPESGGEIKS